VVAKFDYFHIGYATAATAIKFSFFVQVISSRYFLTLFNFFDFPRQEIFPRSLFQTRGWATAYDHLAKITYVPRIVELFHRQGRDLNRIEYLKQISNFARKRRCGRHPTYLLVLIAQRRVATPPHAVANVHLVNIGMHHARRDHKRGHASFFGIGGVAVENIGSVRIKIARSRHVDYVSNIKLESD